MKYFIFISLLFANLIGIAQNRILVDGEYDEWKDHSIAYTDATGDGGSSGIDFGKLQIFNDRDYVFFYIEIGSEINLQDFNDVTVYIDVDNNTSTGTSVEGIGADLKYTFGDRSGTYYLTGSSASIRHRDIGLISAPTVSSDKFEIAIKRAYSINGNALSMSNTVNVLFKDNSTNGDILPSANGGVSYTFATEQLESLPSFSFNKPETSNLRIISYNVERDGLFEANRGPSYERLFQAIKPDIIGFQEIYNHTSLQVSEKVESMLPSGTGEQWYHAMAEPDCHAISRYPILKSASIEGVSGSGNAAFLIDIPNSETDMLLIVAHPPCCTNNSGRQMEVDLIMEFVRESKQGKGPIPIEKDAPIVILGDMNFVGDGNQLQTLLTGNILDNASYGSDFKPDWDGSDLIDSKPFTTGVPFSFSWYSESSAFSPGRLDYILYSGSNLTLDNTYTLFTPGLQQDSLTTYTLTSTDATIASDHLPLVADFSLKNFVSNKQLASENNRFYLEIHPNPVNSIAEVSFTNNHTGLVTVELLDELGRLVSNLNNENLNSGKISIPFNSLTYPSGTYIIKVTTTDATYYKRVVVFH